MKRRCAIYTRKSTEEGLEQAFNSLDAQREACAAYILSQAHEGWELVNEHYDDGGWSGGTMVRPALQQLLIDVAAGRVDVIVVYKVDRLTRSLADFARIVEALDKAGASFVSVTQAFNTTTSMGRLTLNVLLSFAQFEREVTSERIRDKVAASKRKGLWMGGPVPLGYRLEGRKLLIDEAEAETVRSIFGRYLELGSVGLLADELASSGVRTKVRTYANGRSVGGVCFSRGSLAQLLQNPLFSGRVKHRGELFDGEHEAIIDEHRWGQVQNLFATNRRERLQGKRARSPSLLTGMILDQDGRPMTPVFTTKGIHQHRYYVTRLKPGEDSKTAWRVPAADIDRAVVGCVERTLTRRAAELGSPPEEPMYLDRCVVPEQRRILLENDVRVQLGSSNIVVSIGDDPEDRIEMTGRLARRGNELKLVLRSDEAEVADPDPVLLKLISHAAVAQQVALTGEPDPMVSGYPDLKRAVIEQARMWDAKKVLVEDASSGQALIQDLKNDNFYLVEAVKPKGDKIMRLNSVTGPIEAGQVFVPTQAPWLDEYFYELMMFPAGRYDDQVDSTSQALSNAWIFRSPGAGFLEMIHEDLRRKEMEDVPHIRYNCDDKGMTFILFGGRKAEREADGSFLVTPEEAKYIAANCYRVE